MLKWICIPYCILPSTATHRPSEAPVRVPLGAEEDGKDNVSPRGLSGEPELRPAPVGSLPGIHEASVPSAGTAARRGVRQAEAPRPHRRGAEGAAASRR